jgi:LPXTG-motif cell wall-anchored protein
MLLPLVGVALFVLYFLFLRRRRKDEEDGDELAFSGSSYS